MNSKEKKASAPVTLEPCCLHLAEKKKKTWSVVHVKILQLYCGIKKKHLY